MSTDAFLPDDYEAPKSGGGYTELKTGDNRLRVLSNPFMMWTSWTDGKPSRIKYVKDPATGKDNKPAKGTGQKDSVKHSWGLIVWNYDTEKIEVFELDKQEIIGGLTAYSKNPKWGHPKKYDIVINKKGSGLDTEYKLVVEPHSEPSQTIIDAYIANPVDLSQLLIENGNPFISAAAVSNAPVVDAQTVAANAAAQAAAAQSAPAPENKPFDPVKAWSVGHPIPEGYVEDGAGGIKKKMPF